MLVCGGAADVELRSGVTEMTGGGIYGYYRSSQETVDHFELPGLPLGVLRDSTDVGDAVVKQTSLRSGDRLWLMTDGVPESVDNALNILLAGFFFKRKENRMAKHFTSRGRFERRRIIGLGCGCCWHDCWLATCGGRCGCVAGRRQCRRSRRSRRSRRLRFGAGGTHAKDETATE